MAKGNIGSDEDLNGKHVFIQRVDAVLQQHSGAGVENIQFQAPCDDEHTEQIERWVNFAIVSKAKQLIFDFSTAYHTKQSYNIDLRLLNRSKSLHLQSIKLCSVSLKVPTGFKGFQNLKWIFLAETNITDDDIQHLVSNCSVLEFLGIAGCGMLTRLRISHLSNTLKHLQVYDCRLLRAMELNFGVVKLEYRGPSILLSPRAGSLLLADMCIKLEDICTSSLEYMFTKLCNNVPRLEILTLRCCEGKMATLPGKLPEFVHLKHLRLELTFVCGTRTSDILQFYRLVVAAPFLEKLEFHMWLKCRHERYSADKGRLRSLPSQPSISGWSISRGFTARRTS